MQSTNVAFARWETGVVGPVGWDTLLRPKSHVNSLKIYQHTSITIQHRFSFALMWQKNSSCIPQECDATKRRCKLARHRLSKWIKQSWCYTMMFPIVHNTINQSKVLYHVLTLVTGLVSKVFQYWHNTGIFSPMQCLVKALNFFCCKDCQIFFIWTVERAYNVFQP